MGITTSLFVCCLTCSSVAVKIAQHRSHIRTNQQPPRRLEMTKEYFTPGLEAELANTGSGRTVCPICCEAFGEDGNFELAVLACVHAYHFSCLESYALNRPNPKESPLLCPLCQQVAISR